MVTMPLIFGIYSAIKWNKARKVKAEVAAKKKEENEILTRAVNRWLANDRKFDY